MMPNRARSPDPLHSDRRGEALSEEAWQHVDHHIVPTAVGVTLEFLRLQGASCCSVREGGGLFCYARVNQLQLSHGWEENRTERTSRLSPQGREHQPFSSATVTDQGLGPARDTVGSTVKAFMALYGWMELPQYVPSWLHVLDWCVLILARAHEGHVHRAQNAVRVGGRPEGGIELPSHPAVKRRSGHLRRSDGSKLTDSAAELTDCRGESERWALHQLLAYGTMHCRNLSEEAVDGIVCWTRVESDS